MNARLVAIGLGALVLIVAVAIGFLLHHTEVMTDEERRRNRAIQEAGTAVCFVLLFVLAAAAAVIQWYRARHG